MNQLNETVGDDVPTLAEVLQAAGYRTAAFTGGDQWQAGGGS